LALSSLEKKDLISKFGREKEDTGSPEVQIAMLSANIDSLNNHFKDHHKDHHSRQGLIRMVNRRRKLLDYLKSTKLETYKKILKDLDLRR
tara:strand:+ start:220 stop:489 length:270 start_codon:yes stop_codon:yes gene_type:complete